MRDCVALWCSEENKVTETSCVFYHRRNKNFGFKKKKKNPACMWRWLPFRVSSRKSRGGQSWAEDTREGWRNKTTKAAEPTADSDSWFSRSCELRWTFPKTLLDLCHISIWQRVNVGKRRGQLEENLEGGWTKLLPVTFQMDQSDFFYCHPRQVATAPGFL